MGPPYITVLTFSLLAVLRLRALDLGSMFFQIKASVRSPL